MGALGIASGALVPTPVDHTVVGIEPLVLRDGSHQAVLNLEEGRLLVNHVKAAGNPADVGVDRKGGNLEAFCQDHVGDAFDFDFRLLWVRRGSGRWPIKRDQIGRIKAILAMVLCIVVWNKLDRLSC